MRQDNLDPLTLTRKHIWPKVQILSVGLATLLLVISCGPIQASPATVTPTPVPPLAAGPVVAFGDSITQGALASVYTLAWKLHSIMPPAKHRPGPRDTSYPGLLQRDLKLPVYDYGFAGESTYFGVVRLRKVVRHLYPSLVMLMEGVNDLGPDQRFDKTITARLARMVRIIRRAQSRVLLLTLTPTFFPPGNPQYSLNSRVRRLNQNIRLLAERDHVPLADVGAAFQRDGRGSALMRFPNGAQEYVHPNDAGNRVIADTVESRLVQLGLIPARGAPSVTAVP